LHSNTTLRCLFLNRNKVGDVGGAALADGLTGNSSLTDLRLQHNHVGETTAFAFGNMLQRNSTLTVLSLDDNTIGYQGALALSTGLLNNVSLTSLGSFEFGSSDWKTNPIVSGHRLNDTGVIVLIDLTLVRVCNFVGRTICFASVYSCQCMFHTHTSPMQLFQSVFFVISVSGKPLSPPITLE
jgi:hypothetical protein